MYVDNIQKQLKDSSTKLKPVHLTLATMQPLSVTQFIHIYVCTYSKKLDNVKS